TLSLFLCFSQFGVFASSEEPSSTSLFQSSGGVFFSSAVLKEMMGRTNCDAIRFYSAKHSATGEVTVMAVSVSGGADMPVKMSAKSKYQLFSGVQNGKISISRLTKENARQVVDEMNGDNLAVTVSKIEIEQILKTPGCTGIKISPSNTSNGDPTFLLTSATLSNSIIVNTPNPKLKLVENPCPTSCGTNAKYEYLRSFTR
ncbi:MAG TPA: hypothetical protein VJ949_12630, partial [Cryomorphaceae bacterium]|nr:hypothetical protein [Cryomorphaceae bacterium]